MQLVSVAVPLWLLNTPPPCVGRELPLTVQSVSVSRAVVVQAAAVAVPCVVPPVIVSPEIDAVTPQLTWNTRLARRR